MRTPNVSETADIPLMPTTTTPAQTFCSACPTQPMTEDTGAGAPMRSACTQNNVLTFTCAAPSEVQYKSTMAGAYQGSGADSINLMCNAATGKYVFGATEVNFLTCL
uniref:C6 domain-containing protein n=1 Tax=Panagrolaimus sp. PS1159 TaxID=55785 RepID=A0AC35GRZ4_9BILA